MDGQLRAFLAKQVDQRSSTVGDQLLSTANNFHEIAGKLREDSLTHGAADLADVIASKVDQLGDYLTHSDFDTLLSDAEEYCRIRPWTVVAGGAIIGFASSRALKAGSARRSARSMPLPGPQESAPSGAAPQRKRSANGSTAKKTTASKGGRADAL